MRESLKDLYVTPSAKKGHYSTQLLESVSENQRVVSVAGHKATHVLDSQCA